MEETKKKKFGLTTLIFISLLLGAAAGIILHYLVPAGYTRDTVIINGIFMWSAMDFSGPCRCWLYR